MDASVVVKVGMLLVYEPGMRCVTRQYIDRSGRGGLNGNLLIKRKRLIVSKLNFLRCCSFIIGPNSLLLRTGTSFSLDGRFGR